MGPLKRMLRWAAKTGGLGGLTGGASMFGFADAFRAHRAPSQFDLVNTYKNVAYTCSMINAAAVASTPLRFYVVTKARQRAAKCPTKPVGLKREAYLREKAGLDHRIGSSVKVEEVLSHPIIDLFRKVNPYHTRYDLLELTTLYQEITGNAYWRIKEDALGAPYEVWPLHSHMMTIIPDFESEKVIKEYIFSSGIGQQVFAPEEIIHYRYPSLVDPYVLGWSPLRAAFEHSVVYDKMLAYEEATLDNRARPDMLISPKEPIGKEEATRLERKIQNKFRWGGGGGVLVGESGLTYSPLVFPPSDLAALQLRKVSKEELANAFGVPISLLKTEDVNRANAEAGHYQHAKLSVRPKCLRMQEKINQDLCPRFDPDMRLFAAFDDPVPENAADAREDRKVFLMYGVRTINEYRVEDGLEPVSWGNEPILPMNVAPLSSPLRKPKPEAPAGPPRFGPPKPKPAAETPKPAPEKPAGGEPKPGGKAILNTYWDPARGLVTNYIESDT